MMERDRARRGAPGWRAEAEGADLRAERVEVNVMNKKIRKTRAGRTGRVRRKERAAFDWLTPLPESPRAEREHGSF